MELEKLEMRKIKILQTLINFKAKYCNFAND
jgi:hypothetical protein